MFSKYINPQIFFVSLCIGLFICYLIHPKPRVILKCPNPDNEDKITYKDKNGECYKYKSTEVSCPNNESEIKSCLSN